MQWERGASNGTDAEHRMTLNPLWYETLHRYRARCLKRFEFLRALTRVNSQARSMIHRRFPRIEQSLQMARSRPRVDLTWVCPRFDVFVLRMDLENTNLLEALLAPLVTVPDLHLINSVQIAAFQYMWGLLEMTPRHVEAVLRFPNLRILTTFSARFRQPSSDGPPPMGTVLPIEVSLFPILKRWVADEGHILRDLCTLWRPLWDRGIRVMVSEYNRNSQRHPAVEFLGTPEGLRMRFVDRDYVYY
ncbi:hypothetical protein CTA2_1080 [Colletotrichum tanaceti]|uniref:Uncharacterized protein n=1 Tax=Colletotrichum tanaceti TaxID=1306861 RepID=A0A4V6Y9E6_9PEZI|nr:hypothetical protein CTA2_1080 [Colletotrichum tanaceti]TKW52406.1 hypothetical protein CTA1_1910 [Colletotrichum tanaceti]